MTTAIKFFIAIIIGLIYQMSGAQQIIGSWNGVLEVPGAKLPIELTIHKNKSGYSADLKSPSQTNQSIPADKVSFENQELIVEVNAMMVRYQGKLVDKVISGTFTQAGNNFPLKFVKGEAIVEKEKRRPQNPVEPYPYISKDVTFVNKKADDIKLAGTITIPKNKENPPVVILISGSGPQNRNEELLNHRPFLILSDYLSRRGIAVLRYDDRGVGESGGQFNGATSLDFASDVEAAIEFLKKRKGINTNKIGLIGHSEGGLIAPLVASKNSDVSFIVSLAGTGVDGKQVLLTQMKRGAELQGVSPEIIQINNEFADIVLSIVQEEHPDVMESKTIASFEQHRTNLSEEIKNIYTMDVLKKNFLGFTKDPWMHYFVKTDPVQFISKVRIPILVINGSKDYQVIPELNLAGFRKGLKKAGNKDYTIKEIEGLNHLFQTADTGAGTEYETIEETFSPVALKIVGDWILKRF